MAGRLEALVFRRAGLARHRAPAGVEKSRPSRLGGDLDGSSGAQADQCKRDKERQPREKR